MRSTILTLAGAAALLFTGCQTPREPTHFELGERALDAGNKAEALKEFNEAVRLEPVYKYAWMHIGYIKAETQGCKEYTREVRDALRLFLMLESYAIGNVAGDEEYGIPESPREPHLARRVVHELNGVIWLIDGIERDADEIYREFLTDPEDAELKALAMEAQQAVLDANMGVSPRAHVAMGDIARKTGDDAGARSHYEIANAQARELRISNRRAAIGIGLTGGDLDEAWLAVREENKKELYIDFAEAAIKRNDLPRAAFALERARKQYADLRVWRLLAEVRLLGDETAGAGEVIKTLRKWPRRNKTVEIFLDLCRAALAGDKTADLAKAMDAAPAADTDFDASRLVEHVQASKADAAAKAAVKKAAAKLTPHD